MRFFFPDADFLKTPQVPCQGERNAGFTLPELLAVIMIIGILASMVGGGVVTAQRQARQTRCRANLRQFGVALQVYRGEYRRNPPWLSNLFPDYVDNKAMYVCPSDEEKGRGSVRPDRPSNETDNINARYGNVPDNTSNSGRPFQNETILRLERCSYFYEFSWAKLNPSNWFTDLPVNQKFTPETHNGESVSAITWCDYKESQMRFGDNQSGYRPYPETALPIIRCFHHYKESQIIARPADTPYYSIYKGSRADRGESQISLNVAYAGNVYVGPSKWEAAAQSGDQIK